MSAATITQAQDKGLRHQFADLTFALRDFAAELYAAHGGWLSAHPAAATRGIPARPSRRDRNTLLSLAASAESHSPSLSAELRQFASKG